VRCMVQGVSVSRHALCLSQYCLESTKLQYQEVSDNHQVPLDMDYVYLPVVINLS
jgi:UDP-N-acetylglucosamine transferase subunit ALG13